MLNHKKVIFWTTLSIIISFAAYSAGAYALDFNPIAGGFIGLLVEFSAVELIARKRGTSVLRAIVRGR